ncbi:MAG TPA: alpha/beta hydrolase [Stackebrandtia sp.]|jgi:pimeloyl-ACP methyl ester carboxylesterase|uniref:alpha/beta hydrolase n=1 Tax=Stackebrandtia sp. TaxID=2023065 RepID=UPI002D6D814D|nr:alpha/beta hydrolase [Stackebrandtia sp.]HZE41219.1 alpha/beta hydrolase [Stackebrandtia sp.]
MRTVRSFKIGAVLAAVAALVATGLAVADAEPSGSLGWKPCADGKPTQCSKLRVPIDWSRPSGKSIDVAVARRPAADPAHRLGTLIYLPAGPGSSGVDAVTRDDYFDMLFTAPVAKRFDIVSFDPRGIHRSHPVTCRTDLMDGPRALTPGDAKDYSARLRANTAMYDDCARRSGPLFDHLDSVAVARDVDSLRAALGADTINLYGLSYGTLAGQMYAERYPRRIRTAVLDSNMDHSLDAADSTRTGAAAVQGAFEQFVDWCRGHRECALHGRDVKALLAKLYARAADGTLAEPGDASRKVDPSTLIGDVIQPLSIPDWNAPAKRLKALDTGKGKPPEIPATDKTTPWPSAMTCADSPRGFASYRQLRAAWDASNAAAPDVKFAPLDWGQPQLCLNWNAGAHNPRHRLDVNGASPILVLGSRYDTQTPYQWSVDVAEQIDGARLLTYDGAGHGVYPRDTCTKTAVEKYLIDRRLPAAGTVCGLPARGPSDGLVDRGEVGVGVDELG